MKGAKRRSRKGPSKELFVVFLAEKIEKVLGAALLLRQSQEALKGQGTLSETAVRKLLIYGRS